MKQLGGIVSFVVVAGTTEVVVVMNFFKSNDTAKLCPACLHPRYSTDEQPNEVY